MKYAKKDKKREIKTKTDEQVSSEMAK